MGERPVKPLDLEQLNPGIRETVRLLRGWGYESTDSGDGVTNVEAGVEDALPFPHVAMVVPPADLADAALRLRERLEERGVAVHELGLNDRLPAIQASFDPCTGIGVLMLFGVDDALLARGAAH